jgi:hypothetical protein
MLTPYPRTRRVRYRAGYAAQGIPVYLIVVLDGTQIDSIEEHRIDWSAWNYQLVAVHRESLVVELPEAVKINVSFGELARV